MNTESNKIPKVIARFETILAQPLATSSTDFQMNTTATVTGYYGF